MDWRLQDPEFRIWLLIQGRNPEDLEELDDLWEEYEDR